MSNSLRPHELQHARPPCPSPTPGVHSDSRLSSQWCHPAISSSVVPFSSCPQSLPASESFPMSQLFTWGGQSTGVSALASFLPKKSQGWYPRKLGLVFHGKISLLGSQWKEKTGENYSNSQESLPYKLQIQKRVSYWDWRETISVLLFTEFLVLRDFQMFLIQTCLEK